AYPTKPLDRGKILDAEQLDRAKTFARYKDIEGDGIPFRTLPGTEHPLAAYFTRGTGHDESGRYTEDSEVFKQTLDRLNLKWETAKTLVPKPIADVSTSVKTGLLAFGSTDSAIPETRALLKAKGLKTNY